MGKPEQHNDRFFSDLFKQDNLEKAPDGFANRVMDAIEAETELVAEKSRIFSLTNWWMWASIAIALGGLITVVFFVDFSFMGTLFSGVELDGSRIGNFIQYFGNGLVSIFEGFTVSSTTAIIVISIVALVLADRFLRRKPKMEINVI